MCPHGLICMCVFVNLYMCVINFTNYMYLCMLYAYIYYLWCVREGDSVWLQCVLLYVVCVWYMWLYGVCLIYNEWDICLSGMMGQVCVWSSDTCVCAVPVSVWWVWWVSVSVWWMWCVLGLCDSCGVYVHMNRIIPKPECSKFLGRIIAPLTPISQVFPVSRFF